MVNRSKLHGKSQQNILDNFTKMIQNKSSGIIRGRYYYSHLQHYLSLFEREQIKTYLYQDIKTDVDGLMKDIFQFLSVDEKFIIDKSAHHNKGGIPKNKLIYNLINNLSKNQKLFKKTIPQGLYQPIYHTFIGLKNRNLAKPPQLSQEIRQQLVELYREDILKLQDLIQRDLSPWLE
ncbi:sulfotransferase domain-containing protein [Lyngbya aestuarii]|uniref:sulfotransferase domain-containing protein n=1 Tax=Lyngbya aestuarii TaxID=118322 RepID=UPI00403D966D